MSDRRNDYLFVEEIRIDGDDQILKFSGPPLDLGMAKKLVEMGFGWDGEREAWVRHIPSIQEVEAMQGAMGLGFRDTNGLISS